MRGLIAWLRTETLVVRSSGMGCLAGLFLAALFLAALSIFVWFGYNNIRLSNEQTTPEIARIVGLGVSEGRWHAGEAVVVGRDAGGRTGATRVQPSQIAGCHVGDNIIAQQTGMVIHIEPAPCPISIRPNEVYETISR